MAFIVLTRYYWILNVTEISEAIISIFIFVKQLAIETPRRLNHEEFLMKMNPFKVKIVAQRTDILLM